MTVLLGRRQGYSYWDGVFRGVAMLVFTGAAISNSRKRRKRDAFKSTISQKDQKYSKICKKMPCPATILMLSPSFSSFTAASQPVLARAFCNISGRSVGSKVEAWATNGFLGFPHIVSPKIILGLLLRCFPWSIFRVMMFFCLYI